jgi:hypothetical protein
LSVDAHRTVLARAPVRLFQPLDVDVMRERPQRDVRHLSCHLRYPSLFR